MARKRSKSRCTKAVVKCTCTARGTGKIRVTRSKCSRRRRG